MSTAQKLSSSKTSGQPSVKDAIVFVLRTSIRPVIRQELKNAGVINLHNVDSAEACVDLLSQHREAMFVIDWDHGPLVVNQMLKAAQGRFKIDTRPIFLVATEVSLDVVATSTEYNVSRVHTGEISRGAIQEHIEYIVGEESDASTYRASLTRVADARGRGDLKSAGMMLMDLHKAYPDNRRVSCELADNLIQEERWEQAVAVVEQLSVTDRHNLRVAHLKSRCMMKQGQFDEAAAVLQGTKLINPYNVERLVDLGKALLNIGKYREALTNFEAALAIDEGNGDARRGRLQCKLMEGDVNEALALLRQVSNARELASIFNNAAILSIRQGRFEQGVSLYKSAIASLGIGPQNRVLARLVYNLGIAFNKNSRLDDALECFERSFNIDQLFEKARHNATMLALKLGRKPAFGAPSKATRTKVEDEFTEVFDDEKVSARPERM